MRSWVTTFREPFGPARTKRQMRGGTTTVGLALVLVAACTPPKQPFTWAIEHPTLQEQTGAYRLGPDDQISVFVTGHEELSAKHVVSPGGQIVQPLIGTVSVKNLSIGEVQRVVAERISVYIKAPQVSVTLLDARKLRVNTMGEVKNPGQFDVSADESVLDLLGRSGGLSDFADESSIYLIRRGSQERLRFRFRDLTRPDITSTFRLQDGDSIIVQ